MKNVLTTFAIVLGLILAIPSQASANRVVVSHLDGEASIFREDGHHAASVGLECLQNDIIGVSSGGMLDLSFNQNAGSRFLANTQATLNHVDPDNARLTILQGNVILNVDKLKPGQSFAMETPMATVWASGAKFWGRVLPPSALENGIVATVAVLEGAVRIQPIGSDQMVDLKAGQAVDISKKGIPTIRPALQAELDAMAMANEIAISV
ncbi:MAG: hypothetical protein ACI9CF_001442 [Candidatus Omnitrophota bacterium]|jgi:hypothetical protein